MGLATKAEVEKTITEAKKSLSEKEMAEVLQKCTYGGGKAINMSLNPLKPC